MNHRRIIVAVVLLCIGVVFTGYGLVHGTTMRSRSKTHLQQAIVTVNQVKAQLTTSLSNQFTASPSSAATPVCQEDSPDLSLTRVYDCVVRAQASYTTNKGPVGASSIYQAITTSLDKIHAQSLYVDTGNNDYATAMSSGGNWHDEYFVARSGLPGVSQTNYAGGIGLANTHLTVDTSYAATDRNTVRLTFSITQKYASCQSLFVPCDGFLVK